MIIITAIVIVIRTITTAGSRRPDRARGARAPAGPLRRRDISCIITIIIIISSSSSSSIIIISVIHNIRIIVINIVTINMIIIHISVIIIVNWGGGNLWLAWWLLNISLSLSLYIYIYIYICGARWPIEEGSYGCSIRRGFTFHMFALHKCSNALRPYPVAPGPPTLPCGLNPWLSRRATFAWSLPLDTTRGPPCWCFECSGQNYGCAESSIC